MAEVGSVFVRIRPSLSARDRRALCALRRLESDVREAYERFYAALEQDDDGGKVVDFARGTPVLAAALSRMGPTEGDPDAA